MLNLLHLSIHEKMKLFIILIMIALAIYFFVKSSVIEQKIQKLIKAKQNIKIYKTDNKRKYSVLQNSITIALDPDIVNTYEALYGKLTDFVIEKKINQYGIDIELSDNEISQEFETKILKEIEKE